MISRLCVVVWSCGRLGERIVNAVDSAARIVSPFDIFFLLQPPMTALVFRKAACQVFDDGAALGVSDGLLLGAAVQAQMRGI